MASPMSIRLPSEVRARLERRSEWTGEPPSSLAARLIDEGLRTAEHPRIVFRATPSGGRVAGLIRGPDVAEVIAVLDGLESRGDERVAETARWFAIHPVDVRAALAYYADFTDEVDAEIARRREAASELRTRFEREQAFL